MSMIHIPSNFRQRNLDKTTFQLTCLWIKILMDKAEDCTLLLICLGMGKNAQFDNLNLVRISESGGYVRNCGCNQLLREAGCLKTSVAKHGFGD